jgi:Flp pilus assembly protein TadD
VFLVIAGRMMRRPLSILMAAMIATAALAACSSDPQAEAKDALEKGNQHAAKAKYPEAIIEYRRAVQADPRLGEARLQLAYAYASTGDGINALREYVRAADLMPDNKEAQQRAGAFMLLANQFTDAQGLAERMLKRNPNDVEAHLLLANALAGLKDMDGAVATFEKAVELDPNRSSTYSELGSIHMFSGNKEGAEAAFQKAIQLDPQNATAHFAYSNFLWANGDLAKAEQEMRTGLAIDPRSTTGNRAMAMYYMVTNRAPEAEPEGRRRNATRR